MFALFFLLKDKRVETQCGVSFTAVPKLEKQANFHWALFLYFRFFE
jgi:hypothetical protein